MEKYCKLHPEKLAHWQCSKCRNAFCSSCIIQRKNNFQGPSGEKKYLCPKCMLDAEWIAPSNGIIPFWKRLPSFFTYPFSIFPLLMIILGGIGALFNLRAGFFAIGVNIAISVILIKYSFSALRETVKGSLTAPEIDSDTILGDISIVFKQILIYIAIAVAAIISLKYLGPFAMAAILIVSILCLPAMIMVLATTDSFIAAINPVFFGGLVIRMGPGYLLMYCFIFLFLGAPAALLNHHLASHLPKAVMLFFSGAIQAYYTIIVYNLLGYLILQYNRELGYEIYPEDFDAAYKDFDEKKSPLNDEERQEKSLLNQAKFNSAEGDHTAAFRVIAEYAASNTIKTPELSEYFFKLLTLSKDLDKILRYSGNHMNILIQNGEIKKACRVYEFCIDKDKDYLPPPPVLLKLGQGYYGSGKPKTAVTILNKIIKFFPDTPEVPMAYFRMAQILNDSLNEIEKARQILNILRKKYPENDFTKKAISYLGL